MPENGFKLVRLENRLLQNDERLFFSPKNDTGASEDRIKGQKKAKNVFFQGKFLEKKVHVCKILGRH